MLYLSLLNSVEHLSVEAIFRTDYYDFCVGIKKVENATGGYLGAMSIVNIRMYRIV